MTSSDRAVFQNLLSYIQTPDISQSPFVPDVFSLILERAVRPPQRWETYCFTHSYEKEQLLGAIP